MRRWRCSRKVLITAIDEGRLAAFRIGRRSYRITYAEALRFERDGGAAPRERE
jgi:hypothetical protein